MEKEIKLTFRVTEEERKALKILAAKQGTTLKAIVFEALNKTFPNWREEATPKK